MFDASLPLESLWTCLADLSPVTLKGLALMERPSLLSDCDTVREAVVELIAYTNCCAQAIERLRDLSPTPLTHIITVEWML